jgi:hypothetical protein
MCKDKISKVEISAGERYAFIDPVPGAKVTIV